MPTLDRKRIVKYVSQLERSTSTQPKNNYSHFGVSDRSSLSKAGNKPNSGWGRVSRIRTFEGMELRFAMKGARKSGACR